MDGIEVGIKGGADAIIKGSGEAVGGELRAARK